MKNKSIAVILGALAVLTVAAFAVGSVRRNQSADNPVPSSSVAFGSTVMLSTGKSLGFEDGLRVTLTAVNDSRCKEGVQCIWQGELSPVVELSGGTLSGPAVAALGTVRSRSAEAGPYSVTLVDATETTATFSVDVATR